MNPPIQLMGLTAFDEVERKPNLVALCKVMFWKTHIPTFPHSHCLVPRRLSRCERGGRARDEGKGKGCETSGRFCFQDGGMFNGG